MNKVKQARKRAGMKANELAERAGLTPSHISKVERGLGASRPDKAVVRYRRRNP